MSAAAVVAIAIVMDVADANLLVLMIGLLLGGTAGGLRPRTGLLLGSAVLVIVMICVGAYVIAGVSAGAVILLLYSIRRSREVETLSEEAGAGVSTQWGSRFNVALTPAVYGMISAFGGATLIAGSAYGVPRNALSVWFWLFLFCGGAVMCIATAAQRMRSKSRSNDAE